MSLIPSIDVTSSALTAERTRLDIIAQNIANSQTTRDVNNQPYRRKEVVFESFMTGNNNNIAASAGASEVGKGIKVSEVKDDMRPFNTIYMPGHPHADANGMVQMPNVNVLEEMVDMMTATRSFEANTQVLRSSQQLFDNSLRIGSTA
jgi:flagellar basal-body rod protein FlgC